MRKQLIHTGLSLAILLAPWLSSRAQKIVTPLVREEWTRTYTPFRIAGNLYYVGTYDLGCYLIVTPKGNILINTGLASSLPAIKKSIKQLGFRFSDIKILLITHAHFDHVGAMAAVKRQTGALLLADAADVPVLEDGGASDYELGKYGMTFEPVHADRFLHDHDTVTLGNMHLIVLHHPGHTKGSCSYLFDVRDDHRTYRVLIANMPSIIIQDKFSDVKNYPAIENDYAYTFTQMRKLHFDIWLASHASQFELHDKHKPADKYDPAAFIDIKGYREELAELKKAFDLKKNEN